MDLLSFIAGAISTRKRSEESRDRPAKVILALGLSA